MSTCSRRPVLARLDPHLGLGRHEIGSLAGGEPVQPPSPTGALTSVHTWTLGQIIASSHTNQPPFQPPTSDVHLNLNLSYKPKKINLCNFGIDNPNLPANLFAACTKTPKTFASSTVCCPSADTNWPRHSNDGTQPIPTRRFHLRPLPLLPPIPLALLSTNQHYQQQSQLSSSPPNSLGPSTSSTMSSFLRDSKLNLFLLGRSSSPAQRSDHSHPH